MTNFRAWRAVGGSLPLTILPVACDLNVQDPDIVTLERSPTRMRSRRFARRPSVILPCL